MPCRNHPLADAGLSDCWVCGQTFCAECLTEFQGRMMCAPCKTEAVSRLEMGEAAPPGVSAPGAPRHLDAGAAIGFGWRMVSKSPGVILVLFVATLVPNLLPLAGDVVQTIGDLRNDSDLETLGWILWAGLSILNLPVGAWMLCGTWKYLLKMSRGEPAELGDIFSGGPVLAVLGATIVYYFCALLGLALCIVPGVIFCLGCQFYAALLVDRGGGVFDSLQRSWDLTKGHKGSLFLLMLLTICVAFVGLIACCVGLLVAIPIIEFASAYAYLSLTGQRTAESN